MGYNPTFRYPRRGGIGILPEALASAGRAHALRWDRVEEVDLDRRRVTLFSRTASDRLRRLVVTTPLPEFLRHGARGSRRTLAAQAAERLDWSVVGASTSGSIARGVSPTGRTGSTSPTPDVPFYRAGFPSNFSDVPWRPRGPRRCTSSSASARTRRSTPRARTRGAGRAPPRGHPDPGDRVLVERLDSHRSRLRDLRSRAPGGDGPRRARSSSPTACI